MEKFNVFKLVPQKCSWKFSLLISFLELFSA